MHKRKKTPIGFTPKERRMCRTVARAEGRPWTVWVRETAVRVAARRTKTPRPTLVRGAHNG